MSHESTFQYEQFLSELHREFKNHFKNTEEGFKRHCSRPVNQPPIIDEWMNRQSNRGYPNRARINKYRHFQNSNCYSRD